MVDEEHPSQQRSNLKSFMQGVRNRSKIPRDVNISERYFQLLKAGGYAWGVAALVVICGGLGFKAIKDEERAEIKKKRAERYADEDD